MSESLQELQIKIEDTTSNFLQQLDLLLASLPIEEQYQMRAEVILRVTHQITQEDSTQPQKEELLDSREVAEAFLRAMESQNAQKENRPGQRPQILERLWRAVDGRIDELISQEEIAKEFSGYDDPIQGVRSAVNRVNAIFEKLGINLYIGGVHAYRLQRRKRK